MGEEKIRIFEMMCLRSICGITGGDKVRNSLIRERFGFEFECTGKN